MSTTTKTIIGIVISVAVIGLIVLFVSLPDRPGVYDKFATCLKDKGALFYGAFWCPNCRDQKAMFGRSSKFLPYIECSTPDGKGQLPNCTEKGIQRYPTWVFSNGETIVGTLALNVLSEKSDCPLQTDN